jgi:hypothetical protein
MATEPPGVQQRQGIGVDPLLCGVLSAETALSLAWQRLNELRRSAFYGGHYDSVQYGSAVRAYRTAETELRAARAAWCRRPHLVLVTEDLQAAGAATDRQALPARAVSAERPREA